MISWSSFRLRMGLQRIGPGGGHGFVVNWCHQLYSGMIVRMSEPLICEEGRRWSSLSKVCRYCMRLWSGWMMAKHFYSQQNHHFVDQTVTAQKVSLTTTPPSYASQIEPDQVQNSWSVWLEFCRLGLRGHFSSDVCNMLGSCRPGIMERSSMAQTVLLCEA